MQNSCDDQSVPDHDWQVILANGFGIAQLLCWRGHEPGLTCAVTSDVHSDVH